MDNKRFRKPVFSGNPLPVTTFMWHNNCVEVFESALKHGVDPADSLYVVQHPLRSFLMREDPRKVLYLGFSSSGQALEGVTADTELFGEALIHSMPMRKRYQKLMEGGRDEWHADKEI